MASKADRERDEKVIRWATSHGAPIRILIGWDPESGVWADDSPVADLLDDITQGTHVSVAARRYTIENIVDLQFKGAEFGDQSEDRSHIPIDQRVFVDLYRQIEAAESEAERKLSNKVYEKALDDGRLGLDYLSRRWPTRWKEQPLIAMTNDDEVRSRAVAKLVEDPEAAMALARYAAQIEDDIEAEERAAAADD